MVGAGYREELFHARGRATEPVGARRLIYIGKYSAAKGLPWLLDALERLAAEQPAQQIELHVAGSGAGPEAEALAARMRAPAPTWCCSTGSWPSPRWPTCCAAASLRAALAIRGRAPGAGGGPGLRLSPGEHRAAGRAGSAGPALGPSLELVPLPRLLGIDSPAPEDLPGFVAAIAGGLEAALDRGALDPLDPARSAALGPFGWGAVFQRVQQRWLALVSPGA